MRIKVQGGEELRRNFDKLSKQFGKQVAEAAFKGGQVVRTDAIKSIQRVSNGKKVIRSRGKGNQYEHTVSKPGDAPNTDTGRLAGSIQVEVRADDVYVGTSVDYAPALEFGAAKNNLKARPFMFPALERNKEKIRDLLRKALEVVLIK